MQRIKRFLANLFATYCLIVIGHMLLDYFARLVEHFRKHPSEQ